MDPASQALRVDEAAAGVDPRKEKLSEILSRVFGEEREKSTLGELFAELEHHGLAFILILFSIPSALPLPAAGYSTLLSIPLYAIGVCFLVGKDSIALPAKLAASEFRPSRYARIRNLMLRIVRFVERFSRPRLVFFVRSYAARISIGLLILLLATSMVLPIPGTNTLPAGGIFLIGFSLLEDDGILLLAGFLYSLIALTVTALVIFLGYEVVKGGIEFVLSSLT